MTAAAHPDKHAVDEKAYQMSLNKYKQLFKTS